MKISSSSTLPLYEPNGRHTSVGAIAEVLSRELPEQEISVYHKALLTPTNHLFVKGKYIPTGFITGLDSRRLTFTQRLYLFIKYRFISKGGYISEPVLWAHDGWSKNFYHWLCETLPRLFILYKIHPEAYVILPSELRSNEFIKESLSILHIPYKWFDQTIGNRFDTLYTVTTKTLQADVNPDLQKKLRDALYDSLNIQATEKPWRKIYISRAKADYRKIINEAELIPLLKQKGFEIISTEEMGFKEQVILFSQTDMLVSIHGAGHANCMFMKAGGKVLEIRNEAWYSQPLCFWSLANIFSLHWNYLLASAVDSTTNFNNVYVSPERLMDSVNELNMPYR